MNWTSDRIPVDNETGDLSKFSSDNNQYTNRILKRNFDQIIITSKTNKNHEHNL